ncbi:MAG: toll/interleukin-1 receptor domain-containing protein [Planctomycetes bacterium]|nr:toll/interleukin-1 receptor domain-containing protein [Planctomycetota bacterium]
MIAKEKDYDVYISHSPLDADVANTIAVGLREAGLEAYHGGALEPTADLSDAIWQAMAECRAVIVVVSPKSPPHARGLVEIGAAAAWNKPIFVIINGPSSTKLPTPLDDYPAFPLSRLADVIKEILASFEPLSKDEHHTLDSIYGDLNVPADSLLQSPKALRDLTVRFNRQTRKHLSGERLLSEVLRLRKKGQLPRLRSPKPVLE